jgi:uncharacterized integral membrane protein
MDPASQRARFPWPALVLFFLSPVVGELLSGSAPAWRTPVHPVDIVPAVA